MAQVPGRAVVRTGVQMPVVVLVDNGVLIHQEVVVLVESLEILMLV